MICTNPASKFHTRRRAYARDIAYDARFYIRRRERKVYRRRREYTRALSRLFENIHPSAFSRSDRLTECFERFGFRSRDAFNTLMIK